MPTYLMLCNWTNQGIRNVKDVPTRARQAEQLAEKMGCKIVGVFMTIGQYDLTIRLEAPDDAALARFALSVAAQGNIRTTTLKAFTREEFEQIIGSLA